MGQKTQNTVHQTSPARDATLVATNTSTKTNPVGMTQGTLQKSTNGYGKLYTTIAGLPGLVILTRAHHIAFVPSLKGFNNQPANILPVYCPYGTNLSGKPMRKD